MYAKHATYSLEGVEKYKRQHAMLDSHNLYPLRGGCIFKHVIHHSGFNE